MKKTNYKKIIYPKIGTEYWAAINCKVWTCTWNNPMIDKARFTSGNYHITEKEADLEFDWRELNVQILNSIAIINKEDNWVVDWKDKDQLKWFLFWDSCENLLAYGGQYVFRHYENNRYLSELGIKILRTLYAEEQFKFWITKEKGK